MSHCIVIGGGAAGFFAAITCATTNPDALVTILEAGSKPLNKVRISGGGRCNVTHHCFEPRQLIQYYPRGGKALLSAFSRFQPQDTVNWFESQGVRLKTESDGRIFPITDDSQTIVDCLLQAAHKAGVQLITNALVTDISYQDRFIIQLKSGTILTGDRILIATGSNPLGYKWAKKLGHTIENPVPSLFTFNIKDNRLKDLAGISVENVSIKILATGKTKIEQTGALLITHWGISGPGVLKLSAWGARILFEAGYRQKIMINWLPSYKEEKLRELLLETKSNYPKRKIYSYCPVKLSKRLWQQLLSHIGVDSEKVWTNLGKKELNNLVIELTQGVYQIEGKGVFKEEFVTCGGVNLKEIDMKTMESRICPGLYFAGEILDIDGVTGGFNFQNAWTSGYLAGKAIGLTLPLDEAKETSNER